MGKKICLAAAGAGYLGMLLPRMRHRPRPLTARCFAHRGLYNNSGSAPENTMAAFRRALKAGYGIELDIQLTKDQKVVVAHDFHLRRNCGINGEINQFTYRELSRIPVFHSEERIPLLEDVLREVDGKVPLIIELKYKEGSRICQRACEILDKYKGEYAIESFHPQVLLWFKKYRPRTLRGQLSMNYQKFQGWLSPQYFIMRSLLLNFLTRPDFIAYDCRSGHCLSLQICRHLFRCPAYGWTVKSREQMKKAKRYFDGYIFEGFRPDMEKGT